MQYLRARYYNPASGSFNRLDPFAGNMQDPQSLHKYLYVHGDPIQGIDPTGLAWEWNQANGAAAHLLFSVFALTKGLTPTLDFPLKSVATAVGSDMFDSDLTGGNLKPDAVSFTERTYYELKTIRHKTSPDLRGTTSHS